MVAGDAGHEEVGGYVVAGGGDQVDVVVGGVVAVVDRHSRITPRSGTAAATHRHLAPNAATASADGAG